MTLLDWVSTILFFLLVKYNGIFFMRLADMMVDDSGSMQFEENGERIDDLKLILSRVVQAATLFDDDGISIRCKCFCHSQDRLSLQ